TACLTTINTRLQQRLNVTLMPRLATKTWREFTRAGWQQRTHRESFRRCEKDLREVWGQIKTGDPKQDAVLAERWKYAANQVNLGLNPLNNSKLSDGKQ